MGPVTKEEVIEMIESGTLSNGDEISSGNGYWFWIKEKDLLEKYLYGTETQSFNPVNSFTGKEGHFEESVLPPNDDLEYPEEGEKVTFEKKESFSRMAGREEILVAQDSPEEEGPTVDEEDEEEEDEEDVLPNDEDLEYPDSENAPVAKPKVHRFGDWISFAKSFFLTAVLIVILLVIVEKVFKYPVLQLFFPAAGAQESSLELDFKKLSAKRDGEGFVMVVETIDIPENCNESKKFYLGLFMLLDKSNGMMARWKPFLNRCVSELPKDIKAILNLPDKITYGQLQKYLVERKFSSAEQRHILKIHKLLAHSRKDVLIMEKFFAYDGEKKKIFLKTKIFWNIQSSLSPGSFEIS